MSLRDKERATVPVNERLSVVAGLVPKITPNEVRRGTMGIIIKVIKL